MTMINPLWNETRYVASFINVLRPELKPLVKLEDHTTVLNVYEVAKLHEESFRTLIPFVPARAPQNMVQRPLSITYPINL